MKRYLTILLLRLPLLSLALAGCSKDAVTDEKKSIVLAIMTSGSWAITQFTEEGSDITGLFTDTKFVFFENGTMTGTKENTVTTGAWTADQTNYTITTNFPPGSSSYTKINGTWKIVDAGLDFVKANSSAGNSSLYLKKN